MALFQIFKGPENELNEVPLHPGYAYFCEDSGNFFIDTVDERMQINAHYAKALIDINGEEIDLYNKKEVDAKVETATTKAYTTTLTTSKWIAQGDKFVQSYTNENLKCGKAGNVPPIITHTSNLTEYNTIESAEATAGTGIIFTVSDKPKADINITIIDVQ